MKHSQGFRHNLKVFKDKGNNQFDFTALNLKRVDITYKKLIKVYFITKSFSPPSFPFVTFNATVQVPFRQIQDNQCSLSYNENVSQKDSGKKNHQTKPKPCS